MRWLSSIMICLLAISTNAAAEIELGDAKEASPNPAIAKSFEYFERACLEAEGRAKNVRAFARKDSWKVDTPEAQSAKGTERWSKNVLEDTAMFMLYIKPVNEDGQTGLMCSVLSLSENSSRNREKIQAETFEYIRALQLKPYAGPLRTLGSYKSEVDEGASTSATRLLVRMTPDNRNQVTIGYGVTEGKFFVWHALIAAPTWFVPERRE